MKQSLKVTLLGLLLSITLPVFSDGGGADKLTISVYTGTGGACCKDPDGNYGDFASNYGETNLGSPSLGIGAEIMYKNLSLSLGCGGGPDKHEGIDYHLGSSLGMKVYNSKEDFKHRFFGGMNLLNTRFNGHTGNGYSAALDFNKIAIIGGYRYTSDDGIYLSPYVGIQKLTSVTLYANGESQSGNYLPSAPCYGLNVGYQFKRK